MKKNYLIAIILLAFSVYMGCKKDDEIFSCGETFIDSRDGQNYNTVLIGDQCWMAENLNVGEMINGTDEMIEDGIIEKYCYDNDPANCDEYGGLYQWNEMMEYDTTAGLQGICPSGWHIPIDDEWKILEGTVDSQYPVGDPEWDVIRWRGIDCGEKLLTGGSSGFEAVLVGQRKWVTGEFIANGERTNYWSSTVYDPDYSWWRILQVNKPQSYRTAGQKYFGFSVRCLKD